MTEPTVAQMRTLSFEMNERPSPTVSAHNKLSFLYHYSWEGVWQLCSKGAVAQSSVQDRNWIQCGNHQSFLNRGLQQLSHREPTFADLMPNFSGTHGAASSAG